MRYSCVVDQFEDAMRMQVGVKDLVLKVLRRPMINGLIDHAQQLAVLFIEKKRSEHGHDPENEKNGLEHDTRKG